MANTRETIPLGRKVHNGEGDPGIVLGIDSMESLCAQMRSPDGQMGIRRVGFGHFGSHLATGDLNGVLGQLILRFEWFESGDLRLVGLIVELY